MPGTLGYARVSTGDQDVAGQTMRQPSLAENVVRVDMHPADQFEAFARLWQDEAIAGPW